MNREMLNEKSLVTLEYFKILEKLSEFCDSDDAKKLCNKLRPITDYNNLKYEHELTDNACVLTLKWGALYFPGLKNVGPSLKRAQKGGCLSISELLSVARLLKLSREVSSYREKDENEYLIDSIFNEVYVNKTLENDIFAAIISEEEIADDASDELLNIRRKIKNCNAKIKEILNGLIRSSSKQKYLQESIITIRKDRFVIPVKSEYAQEIKGLVHDSSASGATLFIEPMSVVEQNNEIAVLYQKEKTEIERILYALSSRASEFTDSIKNGYENLVRLDFIFSKAKFAKNYKSIIPRINTDGRIVLNNARHPLIDFKTAVPVSVRLGTDFNLLIITGPNTGGKTVTLKTIGLLNAMGQSGLCIPADENSEISVFQNIFADIGDEQSIEQSLSTFSSHMKNIVNIVSMFDSDSLILFDELGAGTDPIEGAALAVSILEYIKNSGARIAATTHYAELKQYAIETEGVENASCEFDIKSLQPTYRLLIGVPGRSNAFDIAYKLGLSDHIITNAKESISDENRHLENVLSKLEQKRVMLENELIKLEEKKKETESLLLNAEKLKEKSERAYKASESNIKNRIDTISENFENEADLILKELESIKKIKDSKEFTDRLIKAKSDIKNFESKMEKKRSSVSKTKKRPVKNENIEAGDEVNIISLNRTATVLSLSEDKRNAEVMAGILKTKVKVSDLELISKKAVQSEHTMNFYKIDRSTRTAKTELDLRGLTSDEAIAELDMFIDNALIMGLSTVSIIHGKGTGTLRAVIHQELKRHKSIRTFRLGLYGEGETGVTIAELK